MEIDGQGEELRVKLYTFDGSNAGLTAQLMLEYKGIPYQRVNLLPVAHAFILRALRFPAMSVPALKVGGQRVQGTRDISRALDGIKPNPPLFPVDAAERKAVEETERRGEELQDAVRRVFYCAARRDKAAFASLTQGEHAPPAKLWLRIATPLLVKAGTRLHAAADDAGRADLAVLPGMLDQVDAWIEEGLLNGEELNAADFQIAPNIRLLLFCEDLAPFVQGRPAERLARRVAPDYAGRVRPVLPQDWLEPLRATSAARTRRGC